MGEGITLNLKTLLIIFKIMMNSLPK